ncbi:MAG: hypothetical protein MUE97_05835 [Phycisphaerales bacterium]|nr:hypothetical protein [Phycisphaerales bacterium]
MKTKTSNLFVLTASVLAFAAGSLNSVALAQNNAVGLSKASNLRLASANTTAEAESTMLDADGPKVKVSDQNTVDLHVKNEDLASVLQMLGSEARKNIIVTKNVSGKISADIYSATFTEALNALLHPNGFAWVEKGNFIYVYTVEELIKIEETLKKRVAKKITLSYLNAVDAAEFVKGMLSKGGEIKTTAKTEAFSIGDNAPVGKDDFALGAAIVVTDFEENIAAIEALLSELDTKPKQVLIESTVLQTKLTEANAFGVDVSILDDLNFSDFAAVTAGPRAVADAIVNGGSTATSGITPADNRGIAVGSTPGGTGGRSSFKFGLISSNIGVFVRMLDEITDTTVLANPKILTLNRQPSRVLVGRRVAYLSTTATETSSTQTVEYLDTGVQLYVRPFVSKTNDIRMEIKPQVSTADIRELRAATGVVTVPDEVTQEVVTNIIVPDGQTVVIGGLFTETTVTGRSQVPWIGDIPIIGAAFQGKNNALNRDEIIFLVTPTIVNDNTLLAQGEQATAMGERLRAGARQSLLPFSRDRMTSQLNVEAETHARAGEFDKALWKINRSLSINPQQESAYRLRDRILGQRENWPSNSMLDGVVGDKVRDRMRQVTPPAEAPKYNRPWNHADLPMQGFENNNLNAMIQPGTTTGVQTFTQPIDTTVPTTDTAQAAPAGDLQSLPGYQNVAPLFDGSTLPLATNAPVFNGQVQGTGVQLISPAQGVQLIASGTIEPQAKVHTDLSAILANLPATSPNAPATQQAQPSQPVITNVDPASQNP